MFKRPFPAYNSGGPTLERRFRLSQKWQLRNICLSANQGDFNRTKGTHERGTFVEKEAKSNPKAKDSQNHTDLVGKVTLSRSVRAAG